MALDNLRTLVSQWLDDELQGLHTFLPVIIEDVDHDRYRCEVSRKDDEEVLADNLPIASAYTGDGYGERHPVRPGDEAWLWTSSLPLETLLTERGHAETTRHRHHEIEDGIVYPQTWTEADAVPAAAPGEYLYHHESDTAMRITPAGAWEVSHPSGHTLRVDNGGITGDHAAGHSFGLSDTGLDGTVTRTDGAPDVSLSVQEGTLNLTIPDVQTDRTGRVVTLGIADDGTLTADGTADIGDQEAVRVNPSTGAEDTTEPAAPIINPADDAETTNENPTGAALYGPPDHRLYESRGVVAERREADPDPTVTDTSNPAYISTDHLTESGRIPIGYRWVNLTTGEYKMWGMAEAPVTIAPL